MMKMREGGKGGEKELPFLLLGQFFSFHFVRFFFPSFGGSDFIFLQEL
jgi:hypothetical protein